MVSGIKERFAAGAFAAAKRRRDVIAIERSVLWRRDAGERAKRRQQIERAGQFSRNRAGRNRSWLPGDRRLAHAAFPSRAFAIAKQTGRAPLLALSEPRP